MLSNDALDKQVIEKRLTAIKPNKMNIGYGMDINKIKGINKFPICNNPHGLGIKSHLKTDKTLFTNENVSNSYEIKQAKHKAVPMDSIRDLYHYDADLTIHQPKSQSK